MGTIGKVLSCHLSVSRGKKYTESVLKIATVIGVSLSEAHTSGKLGMDVTYTNNYEIVRAIFIFSW